MPDRIAWVFPGQGAQEPGMGRDLYDASPAAREVFDRADETLGRSISKLCFEGPAEALGKTSNSQPAIYVMSAACVAAAREAGAIVDEPAFVSGHSLGEYSALAAAEAFSFEDGLRLVEERGRLTEAAAAQSPGAMAALLGLDDEAAAQVCAEAGAEVCNYNAPGQIVIGGAKDAVEQACAMARERGAKRAIVLDVAGAFHTSLMQPAVDAFAAAVSSTTMKQPRIPFVNNMSATAMTDPSEIARELVHQLTHPVRWTQCVRYMAEQGVDGVVEFGPGRVLTGLVKRIAPEMSLRNINSVASLSS